VHTVIRPGNPPPRDGRPPIGGRRESTIRTARIRFGLSALFICLCVVPWPDLQDHSHWFKVQWIPFVSPPIKWQDLAANVALYWPFGYLFVRQARRLSWRWAAVCALLLSVATEWTQLYSHSRFPSSTDVTCNVMGAAVGAWCASRVPD
jgi:glycopeptide antibiotics resistance protein